MDLYTLTKKDRLIFYTDIIHTIDPDATYLNEGSGRIVFTSGCGEFVYKLAKDTIGIMQNDNEATNADEYPELFPALINCHELFGYENVIIQMERITSLDEALGDIWCEIYETCINPKVNTIRHAIKHHDWPKNMNQIKNDFIESFENMTSNTTLHPEDLKTSDDLILEYVYKQYEKKLSDHFAEAIERDIICTPECRTDNIGIKITDKGEYVYSILDGGISSISMLKDIHYPDVESLHDLMRQYG